MQRFLEFAEVWGERDPAIVRLGENAWAQFVPSRRRGSDELARRPGECPPGAAASVADHEDARPRSEATRTVPGGTPARLRRCNAGHTCVE